jgi:hypothetical protein
MFVTPAGFERYFINGFARASPPSEEGTERGVGRTRHAAGRQSRPGPSGPSQRYAAPLRADAALLRALLESAAGLCPGRPWQVVQADAAESRDLSQFPAEPLFERFGVLCPRQRALLDAVERYLHARQRA